MTLDVEDEPLVSRAADGAWLPSAFARGPFEGLQGGLAASLMSVELERGVEAFLASATTHFLKPVPVAPLRVVTATVRAGRRVSIRDAWLLAGEDRVATQRATLISLTEAPTTPTPPDLHTRPERFPRENRSAQHGGPWLMDAMDVRRSPSGVAWFRSTRPLPGHGLSMSAVLPAADWAHGLGPPLGAAERPRAAIPNCDVTVHLFRPPVGEWIGLEASSAWSAQGVGTGWAGLHDVRGLIGRVAMSIAVTLLPEAAA